MYYCLKINVLNFRRILMVI